MKAARDDGGPAFPGDTATGYMQMDVSGVPHALTEPHQGMTLRDYFAAKAMNGMTPEQWPTSSDCEEIARRSYVMANAMLRARQA